MTRAGLTCSPWRRIPVWTLCVVAVSCTMALPTPVQADDGIRMGFYQAQRREMSRSDLREAFTLWSKELSVSFKASVEVSFFSDMASMRQAFDRGEINAVSADGMALARTFSPSELANGYSVAMPGGWDLVLASSKTSGIHSLRDLAGKRIAILDDDQTVSVYLETLCLKNFGRECRQVFTDIQRLPTNNQAIMRLFFDKADLVLTYRYGYEFSQEMNPQMASRMGAVIDEFPLSGVYFSFVHKNIDPELHRRVLRIIPTLHTYPRGRQLLDIFKMDQLKVASPQELNAFAQLDKQWRLLKAQSDQKAKGK